MSDPKIMDSRDSLVNAAAKICFLAEFFSAVNVKDLVISDIGMMGLVEILCHIRTEIETAEAALQ